METLTKAVETRLERLKEDIRSTMAQKGINASHRTERAFNVVRYDGGVKLVLGSGDVAPLETLERGTPPRQWDVSFIAVIKKWSIEKGISFGSERERNSFAYFASKKIAREGTKRHTNNEDVYSTATRRAAEDLKSIVVAQYKRILTHKSI